jgi:carbamoyltransferase
LLRPDVKIGSAPVKTFSIGFREPKYNETQYARLIARKFSTDHHEFTVEPDATSVLEFGGPPRQPEGRMRQREMDIAASIQKVTEEVVLRLARTAHRELGVDFLCMAGGVALNCVANGRILRETAFRDIWIQPAAGDAGGAVGAALSAWHEYYGKPRVCREGDIMKGAYLGPGYSDEEISQDLDAVGARYIRLEDDDLMPLVARLLAAENVIGLFQGRMEFGPRALGARSIIGDARGPRMQSVMNLKIKYRE